MREVVLVGLCGALGSLGRYGIGEWMQRRLPTFPYGTLLVNVVGSLALGIAWGLALSGTLSREARAAIGAGLLGGFTTFSSFSAETMLLFKEGRFGAAAANVGLNVVLGLALAWAGFTMTAPAQ